MKVTKKMREEARVIAEAHDAQTVFVNDKGEFFTDGNHARNSVGGDGAKYAQVLPEKAEAPAAPAPEDKETDNPTA